MTNTPARSNPLQPLVRWMGERPRTIGAVCFVLLLCGFGFSFVRSYLRSELRTIAKLVPEDSTVTATVSVRRSDWETILDYGTPDSRALLREKLTAANTRLTELTGLDFMEDVRPWLGDRVFLAMLPPRNLSNDMAPETVATGYSPVLFLPVVNARRARQALVQSSETVGSLEERNYKGFLVRDSETFSIAQVETVAVISPDRTGVDRAIDAYLSEETIADVEGYDEAWNALAAPDGVAALYFNVASASEFLASQSVGRVDEVDRPSVRTQGSTIAIFLADDGIELNGMSWLAPSSDRRYDRDVPTPQIAEVIPDFAAIALAGLDFPQIWQDYLRDSRVNALLPIDPEWLRTALSTTLNLNLEEDIISWTTGEFALAAIPATSSQSPLPLGVTAFVDMTDPKPADAFFEKLDRTVRDRYGIPVEPAKVGDRTVLRWTMRQQGLTVEHGWLTRTMAFFSVGASVADTFVGGAEQPLLDSAAFRDALPRQGLNNRNGFLYIDMDTLLDDGGLGSLRLPSEQDALLRAIDSITVTGGIHDERRSRYDLFVRFLGNDN